MSGILAEGEKTTELTQSVCMSSVIVYLHSARVFHNLMVLSRLPETICRLSPEKATEFTSLAWPWKVRTVMPVLRSQRRMVFSQEPESANCPSEDSTTLATGSLWPLKDLRAYPTSLLPSSTSVESSQTISFLSREAEMIKLLCS